MIDKGAHFYRCDFQVHSPRDPNWGGAEAKTEEARLEFGKNLIQACRKKGLRAIAITDHHDLLMYSYVRRAAREELNDQGQPVTPENQIVVFPGMELTLSMPCQALLIFDADLPIDIVSTVPVALGITATAASESKLPQVKKIDHLPDPKSVYDRLNEHESLRGKFIVCPKVTDTGHDNAAQRF
jgi:chromosome segregation protein